MAYTETTKTSYGKRLGNSLGGIKTGFLFLIAGTVLLWWNEGRAVKTARMLDEAQGQVVEMPDISKVDPAFQNKLIHATGFANTTDSLVDSRFHLGIRGISLIREVEYYQWVEHSTSETKDKFGGAQETTTTYTYSLEWTSSPVSSGDFHDPEYRGKNTVKETIEDQTLYAKDVSFGAYKLSPAQIASIGGEIPLPANDSTNIVYIGDSPLKPQVGDVRVSFKQVLPADISIIACVSGDSFVPFTAKSGKTFSAVRMGNVPQEQIFESARSSNKFLLWVLRILGFFLVNLGLKGIFSILETLFKVVPFLANIVGWGVGLVCGVIAFAWSLIVAAIAWVAYRPVVAIVLGVVAVAAIVFLATRKKKVEAADK